MIKTRLLDTEDNVTCSLLSYFYVMLSSIKSGREVGKWKERVCVWLFVVHLFFAKRGGGGYDQGSGVKRSQCKDGLTGASWEGCSS